MSAADRHRVRLLLGLLRRFRRETAMAVFAALAATALGWGSALFVKVLVDRGQAGLVPGQLYAMGAAVALALVLRAGYNVLRETLRVSITRSLAESLGQVYVRHAFRLPVGAYGRMGSDPLEVATRFREIRDAREALSEAILSIALDLLLAAGTMFLLLGISPPMALVLILLVPPLPFLARAFRKMSARREVARYEAAVRAQGCFAEMLTDPMTVRAFGVEGWASERVDEPHREEIRWDAAARMAGVWSRTSLELATSLAQVAVLIAGGTQLLSGQATAGEVMLFYSLSAQLLGPVERLANLAPRLRRAAVSWQRIEQVLELAPERTGGSAPGPRGGVTLRHVHFGYSPERTVLEEIDLDIAPGSVVAIVGESGSGKTTLAYLLTGAHRPVAGEVLVDGIDLGALDLAAYRRQLGIVLHRTTLYVASVHDNIALGRPGVTRERVVEAARVACADDFVGRLPQGYDTVLSEREHGLSGGQVQRLGIARAVAGRPALLILDEATSQLDSLTESAVLNAVMAHRRRRTTVIIAHRLSTVASADEIVVVHQGRIVERGTHRQLASARGRYHELLTRQLGGLASLDGLPPAQQPLEGVALCR